MSGYDRAIIEEFRANGGEVGGHFANSNLLLLHTTGAKSGQARLNPVMYLADGDRYVIFASKAGAPKHPGWYHNLVANPEVGGEAGTEKFQARATVASEPERSELFSRMASLNPAFGEYERKTTRVIPVVILTRLP